jgi:chorismate synthase
MSSGECDLTKRVVSEVRPGHADLSGCIKYGFTDARNVLERASARETTVRVAVGAIAKAFLREIGVEIGSHVYNIGGVTSEKGCYSASELIEKSDLSEVRCMDENASEKMKARIDEAKEKRDTLGGQVEIVVSGMPVGIGSYAHYDRKLDYTLMGAVGGVQSVKSVSIGLGDDYANLLGSQVHDKMYLDDGKIVRKTNNAGGIEGGMSNGEDIIIRATLKPIPTVMSGLDTVDIRTKEQTKSSPERSDVCAVPAGAVVIESVVAYEIANKILETVGGDRMDEVRSRVAQKREDNV